MLLLTQSNNEDKIIVTLNESKTIAEPYYHFVFTHVSSKEVVVFSKFYTDDLSDFPQRFNEFSINTATLFEDKHSGQWLYEVYEAETDTFTQGLNLLENGRMVLLKDEIEIKAYEPNTNYIGGYKG